jgi:prepilin-type N-terminal cleavage/methylation domain-containing protein
MNRHQQQAFTLIELLLVIAISGILITSVMSLISPVLKARQQNQGQNETLQQARFAMQQMVRTAAGSRWLLIPLGENASTSYRESIRDVLAITMPPTLDRDGDGWADANNDKDFLDRNQNGTRDAGEPERIDEDLDSDRELDGKPGIRGIDDDGDGSIDEGGYQDNDEDGTNFEDVINGIDDDGDGAIDEDPDWDMNGDGAPGIAGVDDDQDGSTDEGHVSDDDEDGQRQEDWLDPVVFHLNGTTLMQRMPNLNPADGTEFGEYPIAENVTQFRVERIVGGDGKTVLVDITLELSPPDVEKVSLKTRIRVGSRL